MVEGGGGVPRFSPCLASSSLPAILPACPHCGQKESKFLNTEKQERMQRDMSGFCARQSGTETRHMPLNLLQP